MAVGYGASHTIPMTIDRIGQHLHARARCRQRALDRIGLPESSIAAADSHAVSVRRPSIVTLGGNVLTLSVGAAFWADAGPVNRRTAMLW
jgi:hypothetical protein